MPNESTAASPGPGDAASALPSAGLPPAERARLAQCFQRGTQAAPTNADYAIDMFCLCVAGDPGNAVYLQALLGTLRKKFAGKKAGGLAGLFAGGGGRSLKKLALNAQWRDVIKQGIDIIKTNPGDHSCLLAMAEACGNLMLPDAQAVYLRAALDASPTDAEVNRQCARFAANQGQFDQAIECWRRIAKLKGLAEEADKEIARLSVEKTISAGQGMMGRGSAGGKAGGGSAPGAKPDEAGPGGDRLAELKRAIRDNPAAVDNYLELADLLEREGTIAEAEQMLAKALAVSGAEIRVREHVEDRQLRWARHKVMVAEKRLETADSPDARATLEKLKAAQVKQEIDIYAARSARYPENLTWKYELAMRLKAAGNYSEAIRLFQEAMKDAGRKGAVSLELGECFQKIKQYDLAMRNYQEAVEGLSDRQLDLRKRALYRAGVLAAGLNDTDAARKHLQALANLEYGYRDVAQRLEKLSPVKDKGADG